MPVHYKIGRYLLKIQKYAHVYWILCFNQWGNRHVCLDRTDAPTLMKQCTCNQDVMGQHCMLIWLPICWREIQTRWSVWDKLRCSSEVPRAHSRGEVCLSGTEEGKCMSEHERCCTTWDCNAIARSILPFFCSKSQAGCARQTYCRSFAQQGPLFSCHQVRTKQCTSHFVWVSGRSLL